MASAQIGPRGTLASDAEFLRRVSLDLTGTIPTVAEARAFLDDQNPAKRADLIDRLLASPRYPIHLASVFDVMWMERRADKHVPAAEWQKYLQESFAENKPYDVLVREILSADGADPATRPRAKFFLDREAEPNLVTRDLGRMFFGRDLQCAQCHDHPLVDGYLQREYYGIFAFVNRTSLFTGADKKTVLAEKADGEATYQSVFDPAAKGSIRPAAPGGPQIPDPVLNPGEEYVVAPAKDVRPIPKYSRRAALAEQATASNNVAFNRNIANRLWAHMLGRGLVHPLDMHHADNPPSNPELLDLLTAEFVNLKYDIRALLREIALSHTYQKAYETPQAAPEELQLAAQQAAALAAEKERLKAAAESSQELVSQARASLDAADKAIVPLADELTKASAPVEAARKVVGTASAALAAGKQQLATKQDLAAVLAEAAAKADAAAKKLPAEKDLAAAAEKFTARSAALAAEATAAAQALEQQTAALKTAVDALQAAQQAIEPLAVKVGEARQHSENRRQQLLAVTRQLEQEFAAQKAVERRMAAAEALSRQTALAANIGALRAAADKGLAEVVAAKERFAAATVEMTKKQEEAAKAQKTHEEAARQLAEAQTQTAARQDAVNTFAEVLAQAEAAKQKLPKDAELAKTAQDLKTRSDQLSVELAEAQKLVAARQPAAKETAEKLAAAMEILAAAQAGLTAEQQKVEQLEAAARQLVEQTQAEAAALGPAEEALLQHLNQQLAVSTLRPLSPEQMAYAIMQATGVVEPQRAAAEAEVAKTIPLTDAVQNDSAQLAARAFKIEQLTHEKLKGNVAIFVNLFGGGPGQPQSDFFATVDQALYFANGPQPRGWISPSAGNLADRAIKLAEPQAVAEEIYLAVLSRRPTSEETTEIEKFLAARPNDKPAAVQEMLWGLITSSEFRFNH